MPYPNRFHRLVLIGRAYGETWNTSLSIAPDNPSDAAAVTETLLTAVAATVGTWYAGSSTTDGLRASQAHELVSIKLNRIGTDGRYVDDTTFEHVYPTPIPGAVTLNAIPQQANVISLLTDATRGPAHRGRMYLPPVVGYDSVQFANGQVVLAAAQRLAAAGADLMDRINDVYNATFPEFSALEAAVASDTGAGRFRRVTSVGAGRVPDVMRSRRASLAENPEVAAVPA